MKIAVIRRECGLDSGGAEAYCANVAAGLGSMGHEVTVIADSISVDGPDFIRARLRGRGSIAKNISFFKSVENVMGQESFDISYGLSRVAPVDVLRISDPLHMAWLELGYEKGSRLRRLMPRHRMLLMLEKKAVMAARHFVVNSFLVKRQLRQYYKVPDSRIDVIYNGVDQERFKPALREKRWRIREELGIRPEDIVFMFAGSDLKRKGFAHLAKAFSRLYGNIGHGNGRRFYLVVAGTMGNAEYKDYFEADKLTERVRWLGYREDMENIYGISDLFILPTRYDPFANTTLEAMSCGIPVLTTVFNGASEIFRASIPWLVIEKNDSEHLASSMLKFVSMGKDEMKNIREQSFKIAEAYSWSRHLESLETVFKELVENGGRVGLPKVEKD